MTFHKANNLPGLLNALFLCSHPCSCSGCLLNYQYLKSTYFPSKKILEEIRWRRYPTIFTFSFPIPWIRPFSLILSRSSFVPGSSWFVRWKTLVWQPSKSHRTLKVTCISVPFFLHFLSNIEVMIKRTRGKGETKRCLLWSKQQQYNPKIHLRHL